MFSISWEGLWSGAGWSHQDYVVLSWIYADVDMTLWDNPVVFSLSNIPCLQDFSQRSPTSPQVVVWSHQPLESPCKSAIFPWFSKCFSLPFVCQYEIIGLFQWERKCVLTPLCQSATLKVICWTRAKFLLAFLWGYYHFVNIAEYVAECQLLCFFAK